MTVIRPNSISGITSLTAHRGSIDFYAHDGSAATFTNINSNVTSGVSTFASLNITGDLDVGGALTYEDVTNVDSVGIITARSGINVTSGNVIIGDSASDLSGTHTFMACGAYHAFQRDGNTGTYLSIGLGAANGTVDIEADARSGGYPDMRFITNNDERLRITSAGGVGIGTDTPYANNSFTSLSIGGSGKYGLIELNKSDGVAGSWIDVYGTSGNGDLRITTAGTSGAITFWTGGSFTEKLRITSGGDMGLGTASPTARLDVRRDDTDGKIAEFHQSTGYGIQIRSSESIATIRAEYNQALVFETGTTATERLRIESNGYVKTNSEFWIGGGASPVLRWRDGGSEYATARINSGNLYFEVAGSERLRIKSDGKIGINASSGWNAYGDVLLVQGNTGATAKSMISVRGGNTGYVHSALKLSATTHSNSGGNQRGLGVFMHDESSNVEWYAGRPYAQSDYFLITRNTAVSNANAGGVTAQHNKRMWQIDSSGRTVQTGAIHTYQPGIGGGKTTRAFEAKGGSGTYSTCQIDVSQHSYGSVAWDIKVGGYHSAHQHVAGTYYCNGNLFANYTSINNSANVSYTRAFTSNQTVRHTFSYNNGFVHPTCEVTATCGGDGYIGPGDITITWS